MNIENVTATCPSCGHALDLTLIVSGVAAVALESIAEEMESASSDLSTPSVFRGRDRYWAKVARETASDIRG